MKTTNRMLRLVMGMGLAWMVMPAGAQHHPIQLAPAYEAPTGGWYGVPDALHDAPEAPVYYDGMPLTPPRTTGAQPAGYPAAGTPPPPPTAPAAADEDGGMYDEEGLYWVWGQKWPGFALGPKIGTTGIGIDGIFGINRYANLRGGFNYGSFTWSRKFSDVKYDLDWDMISLPLLVDVQPFGGHFRIVAGLYIQPDSKADLKATPQKNVQIGEHKYPPEVIGTLRGRLKVDQTFTPYVGIGFGNAVAEDQLLTLGVDLGVIFQSYSVNLAADGKGMGAKLDTFREDLKKEEKNIQKDLDKFRIYPVLTLSLAWHF